MTFAEEPLESPNERKAILLVASEVMSKRIKEWEKEGEKKDWRKGISSRISNL